MIPVTNPLRLNDQINFPGLQESLRAAGRAIIEDNGVWVTDNALAAQTVIDAYSPLAFAKQAKVASIKADGLVKANSIFPALTSVEQIDLFAQLYLSIVPASRSPTTRWTNLSNVYTAATNAIASVNAATTLAQVNVVNPAWPF